MKSRKIYNEKMEVLKDIDNVIHNKIKNKVSNENSRVTIFYMFFVGLLLSILVIEYYYLGTKTTVSKNAMYFVYGMCSVFSVLIIFLLSTLFNSINSMYKNVISEKNVPQSIINQINLIIEVKKETLILNDTFINSVQSSKKTRL